MGVISLIVGLALGYLLLGGKVAPKPAQVAAPAPTGMPPGGHPTATLEQMKAMADAKAGPLLEKLKKDPNNAALLAQVGTLYNATHQFKEAAGYYNKSLEIDPKNVKTRTALATSLYYDGDVDGAIAELQQALKNDPRDVNAEFNLGMVKFKGKDDPAGAIAVWQKLLDTHPDLDRRPAVEQMIEEAKQASTAKK
jgi:cytochrome c-type biogenesis protein CcmH/NrfG